MRSHLLAMTFYLAAVGVVVAISCLQLLYVLYFRRCEMHGSVLSFCASTYHSSHKWTQSPGYINAHFNFQSTGKKSPMLFWFGLGVAALVFQSTMPELPSEIAHHKLCASCWKRPWKHCNSITASIDRLIKNFKLATTVTKTVNRKYWK